MVSDGQLKPGRILKKTTAFSNSKGGGFKTLAAPDQSIADLLKKKAVYNLIGDSPLRTGTVPLRK